MFETLAEMFGEIGKNFNGSNTLATLNLLILVRGHSRNLRPRYTNSSLFSSNKHNIINGRLSLAGRTVFRFWLVVMVMANAADGRFEEYLEMGSRLPRQRIHASF